MKEWLKLVMGFNNFKVIYLGNCSTGRSEGAVYSPQGVSQTITAGCHGYSTGNIIVKRKVRNNDKIRTVPKI